MSSATLYARGGHGRTLYAQVIAAVIIGALIGYFWPKYGVALQPLADGFIRLIRLLLAPVIFITVVTGLAGAGNLREAGRIGLKALIYFEVLSTLALAIGLVVANVVRPGAGMNVDPHTLDPSSLSAFAASARPATAAGLVQTLAHNFMLQVIFCAVVTGAALSFFQKATGPCLKFLEAASKALFFAVGLIMRAAPLGALGGVAFTVGHFGLGSLAALGRLLLALYVTSMVFVFGGLGLVVWRCGIRLWPLLRYLKEEIFITFATVSTEAVLPRIMQKLENLGCAKPVVGLVLPAGYTFNPDGTAIYLTMATMFIAQATNTPLSVGDQIFVLGVLMLTSKGSAGVAGAGFVALAATLSSLGKIPVAGLVLLLGVDRFLNEARAVTNLIGNSVATIAVATWEKSFDRERARQVLDEFRQR
jgi:aerobic C4-dicarboxylate transport protein